MISAELKNERYLIKFKGKKTQFNEYINKIMSLPTKEWDVLNKCWTIPEKDLRFLQAKFKDIDFLDEIIEQKPKKAIKGLEKIGEGMKLKPYEYQKEAIKSSVDSHDCLLVLPCGAGKTPIGIGIYLEALQHKVVKGPGMIVVKASLKVQWQKEVGKFSDLKAKIIQTNSEITSSTKGKIKRRKAKLKRANKDQRKIIEAEIKALEKEGKELFEEQFKDCDLYILNYEALRDEEIRKHMHKIKPHFIFADEIHYCKNKDSKRSQALYEFGASKMKIGATATPVGKDPQDIYGLFKFINPSLFPSWSSFAKKYIKYAGFGKISAFKNLDHLKKMISPYVFVKTKEEVSDQLPDTLVMQRTCNMTSDQQEMHDAIQADLEDLHNLEFSLRSKCKSEFEAKNNQELQKICTQILALQTFAQELADAPELLIQSESEMSKKYAPKNTHSPKLDLCMDLIDEILESGEKVCIFSRYKRMQDILTTAINKAYKDTLGICYVNGTMSDTKRYDEVYTKFRDNDFYKILLMSDAGAEGINLSKCKYVIEFDLAESYAIQTQRHGRIERADSIHDNVFVYQLIATDSWDEIAQKIIDKKEGYDAEIIKSLKE